MNHFFEEFDGLGGFVFLSFRGWRVEKLGCLSLLLYGLCLLGILLLLLLHKLVKIGLEQLLLFHKVLHHFFSLLLLLIHLLLCLSCGGSTYLLSIFAGWCHTRWKIFAIWGVFECYNRLLGLKLISLATIWRGLTFNWWEQTIANILLLCRFFVIFNLI